MREIEHVFECEVLPTFEGKCYLDSSHLNARGDSALSRVNPLLVFTIVNNFLHLKVQCNIIQPNFLKPCVPGSTNEATENSTHSSFTISSPPMADWRQPAPAKPLPPSISRRPQRTPPCVHVLALFLPTRQPIHYSTELPSSMLKNRPVKT